MQPSHRLRPKACEWRRAADLPALRPNPIGSLRFSGGSSKLRSDRVAFLGMPSLHDIPRHPAERALVSLVQLLQSDGAIPSFKCSERTLMDLATDTASGGKDVAPRFQLKLTQLRA